VEALRVVASWPVEIAAVGVLAAGGTSPVTVGPTGTRLPWASLTKPVTALAVLVAVEEGTLSLDSPAGPPGSTVAHLLAHASGLGPVAATPLAAPGARRIYSNIGYQVLAETLAEASGMPFVDYLRQAVLEPLGMEGTDLDPERERQQMAGGGMVPDTPGPGQGPRWASGAAAGLAGPLADVLALAGELLAPTLISAGTHALAISVAFPGLAGVLPGFGRFDPCDWGLGLEIRGRKQPHWTGSTNSPATFGHFGRSGSFLWVDPEAQVACAGLSSQAFGPWAAQAWPALADAVLAELGVGYPSE
jgi:CubicO group peptidase (beta-lactamase class C family)